MVSGIIVAEIATDDLDMPAFRNSLSNPWDIASRLCFWIAVEVTGKGSKQIKTSNISIGVNPNLFLPFKIEYSFCFIRF